MKVTKPKSTLRCNTCDVEIITEHEELKAEFLKKHNHLEERMAAEARPSDRGDNIAEHASKILSADSLEPAIESLLDETPEKIEEFDQQWKKDLEREVLGIPPGMKPKNGDLPYLSTVEVETSIPHNGMTLEKNLEILITEVNAAYHHWRIATDLADQATSNQENAYLHYERKLQHLISAVKQ